MNFFSWICLVFYLGMPKPADGGLTPKEARFVELYLIYLNATRAYLEAFKPKKPEHARTNASRLVAKDNIRDAIAKAREARSRETQVDAYDVVRELKKIAFSQMKSVS